jgi:hypothetical protein
MFTRRVIMNFKPGSAAEAGRIIEGEVIPRLRQQRGMRHDDTFISTELSEAVLNSFWDTQEYAEAYGRAAYPAALLALAGVLEGTPQVETFAISSSTFHRITVRSREAYRTSILRRGGWASPPQAHRLQHLQETPRRLIARATSAGSGYTADHRPPQDEPSPVYTAQKFNTGTNGGGE